MSTAWIFGLTALAYLLLLFAIAWRGETAIRRGKRWVESPWIYALSLGVYCSAWTFFGSTGRAASHGLDFLTIYLGPTIMAPLWLFVQKKTIRICKNLNISNLADFLDTRYGKTLKIGALAAFVALVGSIPYIALQLKAIGLCFQVVNPDSEHRGWLNPVLLITLVLAAFTLIFGSRRLESNGCHEGLVSAIAFESVIKLVAFLALGIYVCFAVFSSPAEVLSQSAYRDQIERFFSSDSGRPLSSWPWMILLSMLAVNLLPRMFQTGVLENRNERDVEHAAWSFPAYLFLINLFVIPIAIAGSTLLNKGMDPDTFVFDIPLLEGNLWMAVLVFLGGFSAATGMIIVESMALGNMLTNSLILPGVFKGMQTSTGSEPENLSLRIYLLRAASIIGVLMLSYGYYEILGKTLPLVSIGLTAFVAIVQLAPAYFGAIYWRNANLNGAWWGMLAGFFLWCYTLILPSLCKAGWLPEIWLDNGPAGISWLNPEALFGLQGVDPIVHGFIWSLGINLLVFVTLSLNTLPEAVERNYAEIYSQLEEFEQSDQAIVWRGSARNADLLTLLKRFLPPEGIAELVRSYEQSSGEKIAEEQQASPRFVNYCERTLRGMVGTGSTRVLFAKVLNEEKVKLSHVLELLTESQKIVLSNRELKKQRLELKRTSEALRKTNEQLTALDAIKDEFLSTVTHELRTPVTAIRALVEIVHDNPDLEIEERQHFLSTIIKETERLTRLISQVLDLEKYDSGKQKLYYSRIAVDELLEEGLRSLKEQAKELNINLQIDCLEQNLECPGDRDKLIQVLQNLVGNSLKFCKPAEGKIWVVAGKDEQNLRIQVMDNGPGIPEHLHTAVFEKFYQAPDQTMRKPKGSGLGLAICRKIIELHGGTIEIKNNAEKGTLVTFYLPQQPLES